MAGFSFSQFLPEKINSLIYVITTSNGYINLPNRTYLIDISFPRVMFPEENSNKNPAPAVTFPRPIGYVV